jgi:tetratricopeptide (TPR) repeat protein
MSRQDWYRRSTWTDHDREEFNDRLRRSRRGNKAQYLRIQAGHLAEAGYPAEAIELLDRMFREFPDRIQLGVAHLQKAESLVSLGQIAAAIQEFRSALRAQRDIPNVQSTAWVIFPWFVVENQLTEFYDEALAVLEEFQEESWLSFPDIRYRYCVVHSLVAEANGDLPTAREYAIQALTEASKANSGLRYHPRIGLVGSIANRFEKKLRKLADS